MTPRDRSNRGPPPKTDPGFGATRKNREFCLGICTVKIAIFSFSRVPPGEIDEKLKKPLFLTQFLTENIGKSWFLSFLTRFFKKWPQNRLKTLNLGSAGYRNTKNTKFWSKNTTFCWFLLRRLYYNVLKNPSFWLGVQREIAIFHCFPPSKYHMNST